MRDDAPPVDLALFDFDGTITTREMFPDFVRAAIAPRRLMVGTLLLAPLVIGYRLGVVPGSVVRAAIVRFGFTGVAVARFDAHCQRFSDLALPSVLRPQAMARIAWHKARGDTVVVVSGAFDGYLARWCAQQQLDCICSALESVDGVLTGRYAGAQCVGAEKARRVRACYDLAAYPVIHAYGDTKEDRHLLALAQRKTYRWRTVA